LQDTGCKGSLAFLSPPANLPFVKPYPGFVLPLMQTLGYHHVIRIEAKSMMEPALLGTSETVRQSLFTRMKAWELPSRVSAVKPVVKRNGKLNLGYVCCSCPNCRTKSLC